MKMKAILATSVEPRKKKSNYPEPFAEVVAGRIKRQLGNHFGIQNFGVNLTTLPPGVATALFHSHSTQDEFVYVVAGEPTLRYGEHSQKLKPGMVIGFPAAGPGHQLINESATDATILEVGDRSPGDRGTYPNDDLQADLDESGQWHFTHKDGTPY